MRLLLKWFFLTLQHDLIKFINGLLMTRDLAGCLSAPGQPHCSTFEANSLSNQQDLSGFTFHHWPTLLRDQAVCRFSFTAFAGKWCFFLQSTRARDMFNPPQKTHAGIIFFNQWYKSYIHKEVGSFTVVATFTYMSWHWVSALTPWVLPYGQWHTALH